MKPNLEIDISTENCPMTFVRTKLALEKMTSGEILAVTLKGEEPRRNVPRAVRDHGHEILGEDDIGEGRFRLYIQVKNNLI
ncbi:MAG: sulfurtransferase TusA family protein [Geminicoccaceae bacterium]|nr:sulfurtransferase TusA family protein [Geminicoccaceae bacterium]